MMMFSFSLLLLNTQCSDGLKKVSCSNKITATRTLEKEKRKRKLIVVTKSTHFCCALVITDTRTLTHSITHKQQYILHILSYIINQYNNKK